MRHFWDIYLYSGDSGLVSSREVISEGFMCSLYNRFGELGGLAYLLQLLSTRSRSTKVKLRGCPLQYINKALSSLSKIFEFTEKQYRRDFAEKTAGAIMSRLDEIDDEELKDLDTV